MHVSAKGLNDSLSVCLSSAVTKPPMYGQSATRSQLISMAFVVQIAM
jgi:hypothetical protein